MVIRDFEAKDFDRVMEINNASYEFPATKKFVLDSITNGHAWVALEDDKIVGFIIGVMKHNTPYVNNVCVDSEYRGQGIAKQLFVKFEALFGMNQKPENMIFWLQVQSDNPAQKLYFDLGYRVGWIDLNYYGWAKHALCMYKSARPLADFSR
jgi:[ribosomal protein S18]-alanine N-acetyltransferase